MDERNDYNSIPMQPIQTAIEWLIEQCPRIETIVAYHVLEQAKQMEKQQIINAYDEGQEGEYQYHINNEQKFDSETYFNETYK